MKNIIKFVLSSFLLSMISCLYAGGGPQYAYIYSASTQQPKAGERVSFHLNGPKTSGINYVPGKSDITFSHDGTYLVTFFVAATSRNSFGLFLDGNPVDGGTYGSGPSGYSDGEITGQTIIEAKAGSVLTLRQYSPIQGYGRATIMKGIDSNNRTPVKSTVTSSVTIVEI